MTARIVPLAGATQWTVIMEQAGWRCQCTTCPRHKRQAQGRCETEVPQIIDGAQEQASPPAPAAKLIVGPRNPGPDPARTLRTVPESELRAWCPDCWDHAVAFSRRLRRESARFDSPAETLF